MNRQSLGMFGIALLIVAVALGAILFSTRKNRVQLSGQVLKVRTHQMTPENTIALVDMRVSNPSTQRFVVNEVEVSVEGAEGQTVPAEIFAETDARRVIEYYKVLGEKYTPGLLRKDQIKPGESVDRSFAVSVPMTDERLQQRKAFHITVHDVDGATTVIREQR